MNTEEKNTLIEENMPLAKKIAIDCFKQYLNDPVIDKNDLYQAGYIGLIKAANSFDPDRGTCFSTFAYLIIKNEIIRMLKSLRSIKDISDDLNKISLEAKVNDETDETLEDIIPDNDSDTFTDEIDFELSCEEIIDKIQTQEKSVTEEDAEFLRLKIQGYAPKEIAEMMNIDRKHVNIRLSATLRKIHENYESYFREISM